MVYNLPNHQIKQTTVEYLGKDRVSKKCEKSPQAAIISDPGFGFNG
jgi:hypothetical protein